LPENNLRALLEDAARAGGEIARRYFGADPETWDKSDGAGPVTEADLEIDKMLHAELLAAQPGYGWLSEETEDDASRLGKDRVFIVDPIDGTRAFINGEKSFSHSLAVAEKGRVIAAAVYVPMLDLMFSADAQTPATLNGDPIGASSTTDLEQVTILGAKPNFFPEYWHGPVPPVKRKFRPSLAYRLCLVAQGRYDAMLTLRDCWEWDIAAGDLITRQAGASATDRLGNPLLFNNAHPQTKGCLTAGPKLHEILLDRLNVTQ